MNSNYLQTLFIVTMYLISWSYTLTLFSNIDCMHMYMRLLLISTMVCIVICITRL